MTKKCECSGPVCSCGADGVVKDGAAVRVSIMDSDRTADEWPKAIFDAAGVGVRKPEERKDIADLEDGWGGAVAKVNREQARAVR